MNALSWPRLSAYGVLGFPLAFAALPLYVHLPHFYVEHVGLSLASVGLVLLLARLSDALIDPWLGVWSDWQAWCYSGDRRPLLGKALLPFTLGLVMLFIPPTGAGMLWVVFALLLTYLGYSLVTINYLAWGAEIGHDENQRTVVTAWREGWALVGVIVAAALPSVPLIADAGPAAAMQTLAATFVVAVLIGALVSLRWAPLGAGVSGSARRRAFGVLEGPTLGERTRGTFRRVLSTVREDIPYARLLIVLGLSGLAASVPATLVLFFVDDVLRMPERQGVFLAIYFLSAAVGLPFWVALSRRIGKTRAWAAAMAMAIFCFVWAYTLGVGDGVGFGLICVLTGVALGAELALPPAVLADVLAGRKEAAEQGGLYFGIWNFVTKLNLALAAGIALPLLAALGYQAGVDDADGRAGNLAALSLVYSVIPAAIKTLALLALWRWRSFFKVTT